MGFLGTCTLLPCQGDQGGWAPRYPESNAHTVLQRAGQLFSVYSLTPGKDKCGHFCSSDTLQFLTPASCSYPLAVWVWILFLTLEKDSKSLCLESPGSTSREPSSGDPSSWELIVLISSISHVYLLCAPHWQLMALTGSWFYSSPLGVLCLAQSRCSINSGLGVDICFFKDFLWFP